MVTCLILTLALCQRYVPTTGLIAFEIVENPIRATIAAVLIRSVPLPLGFGLKNINVILHFLKTAGNFFLSP